jgi:hypothetical protein
MNVATGLIGNHLVGRRRAQCLEQPNIRCRDLITRLDHFCLNSLSTLRRGSFACESLHRTSDQLGPEFLPRRCGEPDFQIRGGAVFQTIDRDRSLTVF